MGSFTDTANNAFQGQSGSGTGSGAMGTAANMAGSAPPNDPGFNFEDFMAMFLPMMMQNFRQNQQPQVHGALEGTSAPGHTGNTLSGPSSGLAYNSSIFKGPFDNDASVGGDPGQSPLMQTLLDRLNERSTNV